MAPAEPSADSPTVKGTAFIHTPLRDTAAWVAAFDQLDIPVLAATADAVEEWRANEDAVDAHLLADSMAADPLRTLKLLRPRAPFSAQGVLRTACYGTYWT